MMGLPYIAGGAAIAVLVLGVQTWRLDHAQKQRIALCEAAGAEPNQRDCLATVEGQARDSRMLAAAEAEVIAANRAGQTLAIQLRAALRQREADTQTIIREIERAPLTSNCADSPAVGIALDRLRDRAAPASTGPAPTSGTSDAVPASADAASDR